MTDDTTLACRAALLTRWTNAGLVREWLGRADLDERTARLLDDAAALMAEREAKLLRGALQPFLDAGISGSGALIVPGNARERARTILAALAAAQEELDVG